MIKEGRGMSPLLKKQLELERLFKMLRDADKLRPLLQIKQKERRKRKQFTLKRHTKAG
jgi:hypothetical protein